MWWSRSQDSAKTRTNEPSVYRRRDVLKLGAIVGIAVPVIVTMASSEARAGGSWQSMGAGQARAKGSWAGKGRVIDRHTEDVQAQRDTRQDGFVVPGTYQWRLKRDE